MDVRLWTRVLMILIAGCLSLSIGGAGAEPFLYVGNYAGEVQVVNTATNAVVGGVPTSNGSGLVLHPDGSRLYVVDASSTIKVYDTSNDALLATIPGPVGGIAINSTGSKLYISSYWDSFVRVVDTTTFAQVATIFSPKATTVTVSPDGTRVYVTDQNTRVYVLDATNNTPLTYVTAGKFVTGLAVHPSGGFLYVSNTNDNTISVVDTQTNLVVATVPLGPLGCCYRGSSGIAVHPAGTFVYAVTADMILRVIRTSDNTLVASIPTAPNTPGADGTTFLKVHPDGSTLYITKYSGGTVTAVATSTNAVKAIIPFPGVPGMLAIHNPVNYVQRAYVAYYGRPADPDGLDYWTDRMDASGGSLVAIIAAFGASAEFDRRYGGLTYNQLVTKIYQQALNRDPDPAGLDYYVGELQAGRRTLQSITLDVLNGATTAPDSTVVANKLDVAAYFTSKVAMGCSYGTEQDGVNTIFAVTASAATVTAAKATIDNRCGM